MEIQRLLDTFSDNKGYLKFDKLIKNYLSNPPATLYFGDDDRYARPRAKLVEHNWFNDNETLWFKIKLLDDEGDYLQERLDDTNGLLLRFIIGIDCALSIMFV